eukprot:Amastigsp_a340502_211.p7 type:complete len:112 gc:universal Amastigsp_a340502_211:1077-1412(+)
MQWFFVQSGQVSGTLERLEHPGSEHGHRWVRGGRSFDGHPASMCALTTSSMLSQRGNDASHRGHTATIESSCLGAGHAWSAPLLCSPQNNRLQPWHWNGRKSSWRHVSRAH